MCYGIPIFANNEEVKHGVKTNSHSTTASEQGFSEDNFYKYEYHWWNKKLVNERYDNWALKHLKEKGINKKKADALAKGLIKEKFTTNEQILQWVKDVPGEWNRLHKIKDAKLKSLLFTELVGMTPEENKEKMKAGVKRANDFIKNRVKRAQYFKPQPILSKKEITLKVDFALTLLHLPKASIEFKYLSSGNDWDAARDAAWDAARDAAWAAARAAARDAARDALQPTVDALQDSAFDLLDRMLPTEIIQLPVVGDAAQVCALPVA